MTAYSNGVAVYDYCVAVLQEAVLASVGDQELARSGKPIQKALYQEHPAVTAMSADEVAKHRADRDTAVTGADLRPVLQFEQAGSDAAGHHDISQGLCHVLMGCMSGCQGH